MMNGTIARIAGRVLGGADASPDDAQMLAEAVGPDLFDMLYWANSIREQTCHNEIHVCSIVNARSGACPEDCIFCSQSVHHQTDAPVYPMIPAGQIVVASREAADRGAGHFGIVTSGTDPGGDLAAVCNAAREIANAGGPAVCVSIGRLSPDDARKLRDAGVRRVHHNLETSRLETVRAVKAAGLQICCGALFGLGESWQDRIDVALELRGLDVDSVPINFLNPYPGTPCEGRDPIAPMDCLKIIALFRFLMPHKQIKVAGGRERNLRELQAWMYYAGASGTLIGNYLTTLGRPPEEDLQLIADLGLKAVTCCREGRS